MMVTHDASHLHPGAPLTTVIVKRCATLFLPTRQCVWVRLGGWRSEGEKELCVWACVLEVIVVMVFDVISPTKMQVLSNRNVH